MDVKGLLQSLTTGDLCTERENVVALRIWLGYNLRWSAQCVVAHRPTQYEPALRIGLRFHCWPCLGWCGLGSDAGRSRLVKRNTFNLVDNLH
jgi:hypothetical protein